MEYLQKAQETTTLEAVWSREVLCAVEAVLLGLLITPDLHQLRAWKWATLAQQGHSVCSE